MPYYFDSEVALCRDCNSVAEGVVQFKRKRIDPVFQLIGESIERLGFIAL